MCNLVKRTMSKTPMTNCKVELILEITTNSVSYTHLDVYKRQDYILAKFLFKLSSLYPVSYTHLENNKTAFKLFERKILHNIYGPERGEASWRLRNNNKLQGLMHGKENIWLKSKFETCNCAETVR